MRRFAVLVSAIAALMLVWTGAALAQDDAVCNGTLFLSNQAGGTPGTEPEFKQGDTVYFNGTGFDSGQVFTGYTVDDLNSGERILTSNTSWTADEGGNFSFSFVASADRFPDAHEYKVTVYFTDEGSNEQCQKSKNCHLAVDEGGGAGGNPPPPPPPPSGGGGAGAGGGGSLGEAGGSGGQGALPFTGLPVALLGIAGLALLLGGLGLMRTGRTDK